MHKLMKHSTKLIFALLLACFSLSCDDKDGDVNEAKLTVTPETIECSPAAETKTITIQTDESWIVSTQYDWIELSSPIGAGNGTSTVKIQANNSMSAREGSVVVAVKNKQVSIPVSQQGLDISVTPSTIKVSEKATKRTLTVDCKGSWTAESDAEWCTVEKDGNQLNVSILYNQATEERKANIEVKSESGNTVIVTVTQSKGDGKPEPVFSVSSPDFEIPAGEEGDIEAFRTDLHVQRDHSVEKFGMGCQCILPDWRRAVPYLQERLFQSRRRPVYRDFVQEPHASSQRSAP